MWRSVTYIGMQFGWAIKVFSQSFFFGDIDLALDAHLLIYVDQNWDDKRILSTGFTNKLLKKKMDVFFKKMELSRSFLNFHLHV